MGDSLERESLRSFLDRVNEGKPELLPLIHTTQGFHFHKILSTKKLLATDCSVFKGEKLCYMFVGRPSYKVKSQEDPQYWELPIAFVTRFDRALSFKRVFPFDSGAFQRGILPRSVAGFGIENFDISGDHGLIQKFIGTFFGDNSRYLQVRPNARDAMNNRHNLGPSLMEVDALVGLYNLPRTDSLDDRSSAIEVQLDHDRQLGDGDLLGIVLPSEYRRDKHIVAALKALTNKVRYYDVMPVNTAGYYAQIYAMCSKIVMAA